MASTVVQGSDDGRSANNDSNYRNNKELTDKELELLEKERRINAELDSKLMQDPNKFPKAIFFIIPNEMGERFCFYGIKVLLNKYMQEAFRMEEHVAKAQSHLFNGLVYLFPLVGAAISDSFLGKYHTIVYFSILYLIGNSLLSLFSINNVVAQYGHYPLWSYLVPALLIAMGTGGIKPCVSAHGGDQFLPCQSNLLDKFFSIFYLAVNLGATISVIITPILKDSFTCFGSKCYFISFVIPASAFAIVLLLFVFGNRYYRIVPPSREFLPWKAVKLTTLALKRRFSGSVQERSERSHWLNYAEPEYDAEFIEETRLLGKVIAMASPTVFFWMLYDQNGTEWQNQYDRMNKKMFGLVTIPTESVSLLNSALILIIVPTLVYHIYPFLERRKIRMPLMTRMIWGYLILILSFVLSTCLDYVIEMYAKNIVIDPEDNSVISCDGCLNGAWQLPQWILLSLGEAMFSPTSDQFSYTQVGRQMKASSSALMLLTVSVGNYFVLAMEFPLQNVESSANRQWIYVGLALVGFTIFVSLAKFWFVSKEDEELLQEKEKVVSTTEVEFKTQ